MSQGSTKAMEEFFSTIDTVIMGRKTAPASGSFLVSRYKCRRTSSPARNRPASGLTFVNESPAALIEQLRRQPGKNIFLMGGGELARDFLKADLVDELSLSLIPVLLGASIPLFPGEFPQRDFTLVESKTVPPGSGWPQI
jgi:dihydrofolate reductase